MRRCEPHLALQKTVEYENGDGGLVNINFEVADVTRPLVAVGELQRRGVTGDGGRMEASLLEDR